MKPCNQLDLPELSGKLYHTISEVSELCGVKPHVLRYWESEFPSLRPRKGRGGSRRYRTRDIEEVLTIKSLLHEQGYRIAGARRILAQRHQPEEYLNTPDGSCAALSALPFSRLDQKTQLEMIRRELLDVLSLVRGFKCVRSGSAKG